MSKLEMPENIKDYKLSTPPLPNIKITLGEDPWSFLQYHCKKPPNRFQRWMIRKIFGIKIELL